MAGIARKLYQRHRGGTRRKFQLRLFVEWLSQALCFILVFLAVAYCALWCFDPAHFPITSVRLIGLRSNLSQEELLNTILPEVKGGFFRLKVSNLQQHLLGLPWMRQVDIRKVWPNQLMVVFEEHTPAALWGDSGVISEKGVLFFPPASAAKPKHLPVLQGPEGKSGLVWEQYLVMEKTLAPLKLKITHLILAPRGAWHLRLSNGVRVILGTNDILQRLERFVRVYQMHLYRRAQEIAYVDMRYTSGMAVGWKSS